MHRPDSSLKVLHVTTSFPSGPGDVAGPFILRLVESLQRDCHIECTVLTPGNTSGSSWPEYMKVVRFPYGPRPFQILAQRPGGIPQALKESKLSWFLLPSMMMSMWYWIQRLSKEHHLVHAHWSASGAVATFGVKKRGLVVTLHGSDVNRARPGNVFHLLLGRVVSSADYVALVSRDMEARLKRDYSIDENKVGFVPNGVSQDFFDIDPSARWKGGLFRFLFVGSLIKSKGLDVLLTALSKLDVGLEWELVILGDGPERTSLEELAGNLGIGARISFAGGVGPSAVSRYMEKAHCLVLPSYSEGRPSVILEAMAASLPVVASDIPGNRELVRHRRTGCLFQPGDVKGLAQTLALLLTDHELGQRMGAEGRAWMVHQGLTWKSTARRYAEIYKKIVSSK